MRELTSYPWQFKVPFFESFTSKTGYFGAQTESNQMNVLHIDTVFDQEPNETGQIACDSWHISYGVYVPTRDRYIYQTTEKPKKKIVVIDDSAVS